MTKIYKKWEFFRKKCPEINNTYSGSCFRINSRNNYVNDTHTNFDNRITTVNNDEFLIHH